MNAQDSDYKEAASSHWRSAVTRSRVLFFLVVLLLAGSVRLLTFNFLRNRLDDPAWFQRGTYAAFEERAVAVIDGKEPIFWVSDPSRTDVIFFPPGYPLMIAAIFRLTGQHSIYAVQAVQTVIDLLGFARVHHGTGGDGVWFAGRHVDQRHDGFLAAAGTS